MNAFKKFRIRFGVCTLISMCLYSGAILHLNLTKTVYVFPNGVEPYGGRTRHWYGFPNTAYVVAPLEVDGKYRSRWFFGNLCVNIIVFIAGLFLTAIVIEYLTCVLCNGPSVKARVKEETVVSKNSSDP